MAKQPDRQKQRQRKERLDDETLVPARSLDGESRGEKSSADGRRRAQQTSLVWTDLCPALCSDISGRLRNRDDGDRLCSVLGYETGPRNARPTLCCQTVWVPKQDSQGTTMCEPGRRQRTRVDCEMKRSITSRNGLVRAA